MGISLLYAEWHFIADTHTHTHTYTLTHTHTHTHKHGLYTPTHLIHNTHTPYLNCFILVCSYYMLKSTHQMLMFCKLNLSYHITYIQRVIIFCSQVVGILAGFGILLLVASPFLLLAAPCILCCKCKICKCCEDNGELDGFTSSWRSANSCLMPDELKHRLARYPRIISTLQFLASQLNRCII